MIGLMRTIPVALCLALAGCGTFAAIMCGPTGDSPFYSGVRMDVRCIGEKEGWLPVLMALDIPFSAAADTLLLPYIVYYQYQNASEKGGTTRQSEPSQIENTKQSPSNR